MLQQLRAYTIARETVQQRLLVLLALLMTWAKL